MEAVILVGLIGAGLLMDKEKKDPVQTNVNKDISFPSMDNTYESTYYDKTQDIVRGLAHDKFKESHQPGNTVNFQKTKTNHGLQVPVKDLIDSTKEGYTDYAKYTYSTSAGGYVSNEDFLTNDQGIKVAPFFSSQPPNVNFDDSRQLERTQGRIEGSRSKMEVSGNAFSDLSPNMGNVFGNTFDSHRADQSRYDNGFLRTNELPFEQERIAPIDSMSNFNREIGQTIADRRNIDNLRTLSNQKSSYEGRVNAGKGFDHRGKEGEVYKHSPETFYKNNPDKWFVTNGAFLAKSERPEQIIPDTNRQFFNKGEFGPAAPAVQENGELRGNYKKTLRQQLGSDTVRNATSEVPILNNDMVQQGYRALPNERQVTELRTYDSNIKTEVSSQMVGLQDEAKNTLNDFIEKYFGPYQIIESEKGVIPMSSILPEQKSDEKIVNIGTRAGNVKPSTGYAFKNMYNHSKLICKNGKLKSRKVRVNKRFLFYDQLLLIILTIWPLKGKLIFERLFKIKSSGFILKFLDEKTSILEDMSMFLKLQIWIFIKSALFWSYWKIKKTMI